MGKKLFVRNISFKMKENDINDLFSRFGQVHSVVIVKDHQTEKSRGFGFVEMEQEDAMRAMQELNGSMFDNRTLWVDEARERRSVGSQPYRNYQKAYR